jgi:hypothetical protein
VVGVQHQAGVEDLDLALRRAAAGDLEQEVGGDAECGIRLGRLAAAAGGVVAGDQQRLLRGEAGRLGQVGLARVAVLVRVVGAGERHQGAQRLHRFLLLRDLGDVRRDERAQLPATHQLLTVGGELGPVGQLPALQQVCGLLERRAAGQVVDVVSTIEQATGLPVDVAERCGRCDDICQAFCGLVRHEYFLRLSPVEVYL